MKIDLPPFVKEIIATFQKNNLEIYIVGGVVRDLMLGRIAVDWDFTTNATPEMITSLFPESFYDNKFGTVGVVNPEDEKPKKGKPPVYEITTFRTEIGYSDQRHPDKIVWGKTLREDLVRRDFTINAMALKPMSELAQSQIADCKLIDLHGGQKDMAAKLIRAVGNADERFKEDALRMLRAVRIATQLGFTIEENTFEAIKSNLSLLDKISLERTRDELFKLLSYPQAAEGYQIMREAGLAQKILPELEKGFGVEQKSPGRHHIFDVGTHSLLSLKNCRSNDPIVKLATLIHDIGKPITYKKLSDGTITFYNHEVPGASVAKKISQRLKLSKKDSQRLFLLVRWHQFSVDERQTDSALRRFIRNVGQENLKDMLTLRVADRLGGGARETSWRLEAFKKRLIEVQKQPFTVADLKIDGHDVMKILNLKPGKKVGEILLKLFKEVEEDKNRNNRQSLLKRLKSFC